MFAAYSSEAAQIFGERYSQNFVKFSTEILLLCVEQFCNAAHRYIFGKMHLDITNCVLYRINTAFTLSDDPYVLANEYECL